MSTTPTIAQRFMHSAFLPVIYERVWRPVGFGLAKGRPLGPSTAEEYALAREWLGLGTGHAGPDAAVLDVACGPGNVTRALAAGVGPGGRVVGIDASRTMLAQAAADTAPGAGPGIEYLLGDATDLPFQDGSFDAVCCFGGLYLFADPWAALDGMARVLRPGGRIVLLTSRRPRLPVTGLVAAGASRLAGVRLFGHDELVKALRARGFSHVKRRSCPLMQYVGARLP